MAARISQHRSVFALMQPSVKRATLTSVRKEVMTVFEYKFVRIGENRLSALFGPQGKARSSYEAVVYDHARDGWRLVQIFAPGVAAFGAAKYYELIFERELAAVEAPSPQDAELALQA